MRPQVLVTLTTVMLCVTTASAETFTETFDDGSNVGGWTFGSPNGFIDSSGGNPGPFYHDTFLDTYAPQPRTTVDSIFTGDYRANNVTSVGIDLVLFYVDFSADGRPLTVVLRSDNDTPADGSDDWAAYCIGERNVPLVGQGWISYDFAIPAQETSLPAGWEFILFGPGSPPSPDWNDLITDVDQLIFFYGDPTMFFIFQAWDLGLDNPRITYGAEPCFGDLDGDNDVDLADLAQLLANYGTTEGAAYEDGDLDEDGDVDLADLAALLAVYGTTCP
jgi:hypothetical protein